MTALYHTALAVKIGSDLDEDCRVSDFCTLFTKSKKQIRAIIVGKTYFYHLQMVRIDFLHLTKAK